MKVIDHKVELYDVAGGQSSMPTGHVKWFNNAKGYGFILCENSSEDFFAHYSSIQMDGYKTLKAGQSVSFDILAGPKGSHAINIQSNEAFSTEDDTSDKDGAIEPDTTGEAQT